MTAIDKSFIDEGVLSGIIKKYKGLNIFNLYYFVLFIYVFPFISLFLFFIDQITFNKTEMLFWLIFLLALAPCGFIGVFLCSWGLVKSVKKKSRINKVIGTVGLLLGLGGMVAGILGVLLIYVVVS
jgi:hypothetical protein